MSTEIQKSLYLALKSNYESQINQARATLLIYFSNSVGIGEHSDIVEAIQKELSTMGSAHERLEMIDKYFNDNSIETR